MSFLKRKTHKPQAVETITEPEQGFAQIAFTDIDTAIDNKLTAAEWRLWMYLMKIDRYGDKWRDLPAPTEIAVRLGMDRRTVEKAMFRLNELGLYLFEKAEYTDTERRLHYSLHQELGGLTEVRTPSGRVDLLTETEIIEVKRIGDLKAALGQILIYSSFYPEHQKRLHLFGSAKELEALAGIEASVLSFEVSVTGEEVQS